MIRAPAFWTRDGGLARLLAPLSRIPAAIVAHRLRRPGWRAPVPVICCGNATVGGAGKTTLALDLARRLTARGLAVHVLLRGYGGAARGPRRVMPGDSAALTGDEALLLARVAPTWTGADRAASARAAVAAGAEVLLMDDGLQNPSLEKTLSLLVVDGTAGFGNGRVLPAGPLREPVAEAASRCQAAVLIGPDTSHALALLPPGLPVLRAALVQGDEIAALTGRRVVAFAGIAHPEKFFRALDGAGVFVLGREAFADHHAFTAQDLARLGAKARELDAILVTTPKDAVRLPGGMPEATPKDDRSSRAANLPRHGTARPGHPNRHRAATDGAVEPRHDGWGTIARLVYCWAPPKGGTPKGASPEGFAVRVVDVRLAWEQEAAIERLLADVIPSPRPPPSVA